MIPLRTKYKIKDNTIPANKIIQCWALDLELIFVNPLYMYIRAWVFPLWKIKTGYLVGGPHREGLDSFELLISRARGCFATGARANMLSWRFHYDLNRFSNNI